MIDKLLSDISHTNALAETYFQRFERFHQHNIPCYGFISDIGNVPLLIKVSCMRDALTLKMKNL